MKCNLEEVFELQHQKDFPVRNSKEVESSFPGNQDEMNRRIRSFRLLLALYSAFNHSTACMILHFVTHRRRIFDRLSYKCLIYRERLRRRLKILMCHSKIVSGEALAPPLLAFHCHLSSS